MTSATVDLSGGSLAPAEAKAEIARLTAEFKAKLGARVKPPTDPAARLEQRTNDPKFGRKLLAGDADTVREFQELTKKAAEAGPHSASPTDAPSYPVETVGPDQLPRREYEAWFAGLRERGLRANTEQYIRDLDAGRRDERICAGAGAECERRLRQLERLPGFDKKIDPKNPAFDPKALDLWTRLTVAVTLADKNDASEVPARFYEDLDRHVAAARF